MNMIRLSSGFAIALAACAVACSGAPGSQDLSGGDTSGSSHAPIAIKGRGTFMPTPRDGDSPKKGDGSGDFPGQPGGQQIHMTYRGGPVISNVKVFTVFWGSNVANQKDLDSFYAAIADSEYVGQLSEYDTSTQKIGPGQFVSSYVDTGAPTDSQLSDDDVQQELTNLIQAGSIPQPDANTLFMVHFPPGVSISMQGASSCQQFCAYHSSFQVGGADVYYGILPDFSGDSCGHCNVESKMFDSTTVVASHEVAEAITDPNIGVANSTQDESQLGWYDDVNDEIGDVCEGQSVTFAGFRVTKLWSNQHNACVAPAATHGR